MRRTLHVVWLWAPAVVWVGVIALTSGEIGAQTHSDVWVLRTLHEWLPWFFGTEASSSPVASTFLPWWVRKLAHVAEYAVLGALIARAFLRSVAPAAQATLRPRSSRRLAGLGGLPAVVVIALPLCGAVAILDEENDGTLASRTGSPLDGLFDVVGGGVGLAVGWWVFRGAGDAPAAPADGSPARPCQHGQTHEHVPGHDSETGEGESQGGRGR